MEREKREAYFCINMQTKIDRVSISDLKRYFARGLLFFFYISLFSFYHGRVFELKLKIHQLSRVEVAAAERFDDHHRVGGEREGDILDLSCILATRFRAAECAYSDSHLALTLTAIFALRKQNLESDRAFATLSGRATFRGKH